MVLSFRHDIKVIEFWVKTFFPSDTVYDTKYTNY